MVARRRKPSEQALRVAGFNAVIGRAPRVLILGSMPSTRSLEQAQYYAHPRNAFWPIMDTLGLARADVPYVERLVQLTDAGVALWDSLKACKRSGSLDTAIDASTEEANDLAALLDRYPTIRAVVFNGAKAETAFRRHIVSTLAEQVAERLTLVRLPSTSPAHTIPRERKAAAWRVILRFLQDAG